MENAVISNPVVTTQNLARLSNLAVFFRSKKTMYRCTSSGSVSVFLVHLLNFSLSTEECSFTKLHIDAPLMLYSALNSFLNAVGMEELERRQRAELLHCSSLELVMIAPLHDGIGVGFVLWHLQKDIGISETPIHGSLQQMHRTSEAPTLSIPEKP